jgi:MFS transporter
LLFDRWVESNTRELAVTNDPAEATAHKWVVTGTVLTGTIMAVLDSSIVNVALPDMSGTLGVTIEEITWVVTAYILAQVIVMPITGQLASRFGRKRCWDDSRNHRKVEKQAADGYSRCVRRRTQLAPLASWGHGAPYALGSR